MIFDGHSDLLYALDHWRRQGEVDVFRRRYAKAFRQGQVEGGIFVLWPNPEKQGLLRLQVLRQMETLQAECAAPDSLLCLVHNRATLLAAQQSGQVAVLLGAEGLDAYPPRLTTIDWLYQKGVRHVSLTWNQGNAFAGGVQATGGLTKLGRHAVQAIGQAGMLLDVSHLNDRSLREVLQWAEGPVIASHSNSRTRCNAPRNLTNHQVKAIAATGGLIGVNSYPPFLEQDAARASKKSLLDHLVYLAWLVGPTHLALGLDLNYWDDIGTAPQLEALRDYQDAATLPQAMRERGFSAEESEQICRGNYLRLLETVLE